MKAARVSMKDGVTDKPGNIKWQMPQFFQAPLWCEQSTLVLRHHGICTLIYRRTLEECPKNTRAYQEKTFRWK